MTLSNAESVAAGGRMRTDASVGTLELGANGGLPGSGSGRARLNRPVLRPSPRSGAARISHRLGQAMEAGWNPRATSSGSLLMG
jgi:hypothetical protein